MNQSPSVVATATIGASSTTSNTMKRAMREKALTRISGLVRGMPSSLSYALGRRAEKATVKVHEREVMQADRPPSC
jgi:hypothetical protein